MLRKHDYEALSAFRYQLRRFERFSEVAAQEAGITALQYFLLLHVKGSPGRDWASVSELAERLQAQPHGVVALVSRCEAAGLVVRRHNKDDARLVEVHLRPKGERLVEELARLHREEIALLDRVFPAALIER